MVFTINTTQLDSLKTFVLTLFAFLPELVLLNFSLFIVFYAVFVWNGSKTSFTDRALLLARLITWARWVTVSIFLIYGLFWNFCCLASSTRYFFVDQFIFDWPVFVLKLLILIALFYILAMSRTYMLAGSHQSFGYEFLIILLLACSGSLLVASAYDFLSLYVAIELQALAFYVLAAFKTDSELSTEASIKYFIVGAFASIVLLLGISFVYGAAGLTNFYQLGIFLTSAVEANYTDTSLVLGLFLIFIALALKLGLAPFHFWLPDAYQGAPLPVTAFFSLVPKISFIFIIIRLYVNGLGGYFIERVNVFNHFDFFIFNYLTKPFGFLFISLGFCSVALGSFLGLGQQNIKRLFAYSSIANSGFIVLALGLSTAYALQAACVYLLIYVLLTINFFLLVIAIKCRTEEAVFSISNLSEINSPILGLCLSLNLFSLAGIPPLIGFYSKLYVYLSLVDGQYYLLTLLVAFLTILSTFYYVRLVAIIFFIPSVRGLFYEFLLPSSSKALLARPVDLALIHGIVLLTMLNLFFFAHFDYLVLISLKFSYFIL